MAVVTTGSHPKELWPGIKRIYGTTYAEKPMVCEQVFDLRSSDKRYEEYLESTGLGLAAIKAENAAISYDTTQQGHLTRITNVTYALGKKVSMEAIQDNQYKSVASEGAKQLARSMRHTKENVFANILNRAFDSGYPGGDGVELLSTAHPTLNGTQGNELAVAADFSEASLEDMLTLIRGMTDSRGLRIQAKGQMLIVPPQLEFDVKRVLESTLQSGTANNDINAVKGMLPGGVVVWDYLTDPDAFFIKTDIEGLIRQERMAPELTQDNDFDTKNACMAVVTRFAGGWDDWRAIVGTPGA